MTENVYAPGILFWGTPGAFADSAFRVLFNAGARFVGVVVPDDARAGWRRLSPPPPPESDVMMQRSFVAPGLIQSAWQRGIPVFGSGEFNRPHFAEVSASIAALNPALIVVACWHARLPQWLLQIPRWGGLNIHPSRLPDFRGPVPLFWQRRAGLVEGAVTVHAMNAKWDDGAIYAQASLPFPDGAAMDTLDHLTGTVGGGLVVQTISALAQGMAQPAPQPPGGSYQSFPHAADFTVPTEWTARHAWNFMRAAESFGTSFAIALGDRTIVAQRAVAYRPGIHNHKPLLQTPSGQEVQFTSGVLVVR